MANKYNFIDEGFELSNKLLYSTEPFTNEEKRRLQVSTCALMISYNMKKDGNDYDESDDSKKKSNNNLFKREVIDKYMEELAETFITEKSGGKYYINENSFKSAKNMFLKIRNALEHGSWEINGDYVALYDVEKDGKFEKITDLEIDRLVLFAKKLYKAEVRYKDFKINYEIPVSLDPLELDDFKSFKKSCSNVYTVKMLDYNKLNGLGKKKAEKYREDIMKSIETGTCIPGVTKVDYLKNRSDKELKKLYKYCKKYCDRYLKWYEFPVKITYDEYKDIIKPDFYIELLLNKFPTLYYPDYLKYIDITPETILRGLLVSRIDELNNPNTENYKVNQSYYNILSFLDGKEEDTKCSYLSANNDIQISMLLTSIYNKLNIALDREYGNENTTFEDIMEGRAFDYSLLDLSLIATKKINLSQFFKMDYEFRNFDNQYIEYIKNNPNKKESADKLYKNKEKYIKNFNLLYNIRSSLAHGNYTYKHKLHPKKLELDKNYILFNHSYENDLKYRKKVDAKDLEKTFSDENLKPLIDFIDSKKEPPKKITGIKSIQENQLIDFIESKKEVPQKITGIKKLREKPVIRALKK